MWNRWLISILFKKNIKYSFRIKRVIANKHSSQLKRNTCYSSCMERRTAIHLMRNLYILFVLNYYYYYIICIVKLLEMKLLKRNNNTDLENTGLRYDQVALFTTFCGSARNCASSSLMTATSPEYNKSRISCLDFRLHVWKSRNQTLVNVARNWWTNWKAPAAGKKKKKPNPQLRFSFQLRAYFLEEEEYNFLIEKKLKHSFSLERERKMRMWVVRIIQKFK